MKTGFKFRQLCLKQFRTWAFGAKRNRATIFCGIILTCIFIFITSLLHKPDGFQRSHIIVHKDRIHLLYPDGHYELPSQNGTSGLNSSGTEREIWNHPVLNILTTKPYEFLPNYKNPCWYEPLREANVYQSNKYALLSRAARTTMVELMEEWSNRISRDSNAQRLRCLPYFLIVGQPKCGTTDIYKKIIAHPDVVTPPIKELHWWSRNRQGRRLNYTDLIPLSDYIDMFDKAAMQIEKKAVQKIDKTISYHSVITGEASASVFWENDDWWHFPENAMSSEPLYTNPSYIRHMIPNARIIICVRDPSKRLFSDYLYFTPQNKSADDFHTHVSYAVEVYNNCTREHSARYCVYNKTVAYKTKVRLRLGMYSVFLQDWLDVFPRDQILVLTLEEYAENTRLVILKIFKFLQLRKLAREDLRQIVKQPTANKRKYKDKKVGDMLNSTRQILDQFYKPYNEQLAAILNDEKYLFQNMEDDS